jgi:hypothetical protein
MSCMIVRINEAGGRVTRTLLQGFYGTTKAAEEALEKALAEYKEHGRDELIGGWWARDAEGREYKFHIRERAGRDQRRN